MATDKGANWVHIVVAVITVVGGIAVAVISKEAHTKKEQEAPIVEAVSEAVAPLPLAVSGVLIGKAGDQPFVSEISTQFTPGDDIAITVRYTAAQEVANFPVRLSARIASGLMNGAGSEQVTDVSRPGSSFWTFHFRPKDAWIGQQFVWIEVNGQKVYSQTVNIRSE